MTLTWKDGVTTALSAAVVGLAVTFATSPRPVAAAILLIGVAQCVIGADAGAPRWAALAGGLLGVSALAAAVVTIAAGSGTFLAILVAVVLTLWALTTARHAWPTPTEPRPAEVQLEQFKDELPPRLNVG